MRLYLSEFTEEPKHLHFSANDAKEVWFIETIREAQREIQKEAFAAKEDRFVPAGTVPEADVEVRKSLTLFFVRGHLDLDLTLTCARCTTAFPRHFHSKFDRMFTKEFNEAKRGSSGVAYSEPTGSDETDLDVETLEKDYIELSDVVREQIYLQVPIQPLCKEDCKGLCAVCGQDQNKNPCQCHRLKSGTMASALKKFLK